MFNKFYYENGNTGMFVEVPLEGPRLISCRPWSSPGWPQRRGSYLSYASGVPAPGRPLTLGVATTTHKHNVQMLPDVV